MLKLLNAIIAVFVTAALVADPLTAAGWTSAFERSPIHSIQTSTVFACQAIPPAATSWRHVALQMQARIGSLLGPALATLAISSAVSLHAVVVSPPAVQAVHALSLPAMVIGGSHSVWFWLAATVAAVFWGHRIGRWLRILWSSLSFGDLDDMEGPEDLTSRKLECLFKLSVFVDSTYRVRSQQPEKGALMWSLAMAHLEPDLANAGIRDDEIQALYAPLLAMAPELSSGNMGLLLKDAFHILMRLVGAYRLHRPSLPPGEVPGYLRNEQLLAELKTPDSLHPLLAEFLRQAQSIAGIDRPEGGVGSGLPTNMASVVGVISLYGMGHWLRFTQDLFAGSAGPVLIIGLVILFDQFSKLLVRRLRPASVRPLRVPSLIRRVAPALLGFALVLVIRSDFFATLSPLSRIGFALLLGGATSNVGETMLRGRVTDWIPPRFKRAGPWNLADIANAIGIGILLYGLLLPVPVHGAIHPGGYAPSSTAQYQGQETRQGA